MAARLTVIVCQAGAGNSSTSDIEETLVAELMMTPGLDATMIGPLDRVDSDDTDYLCISSFNHSLAVVTWMESGEVQQEWNRLRLKGKVVDFATLNDQGVGHPSSAGNERQVFHLRLDPASSTKQVIQELQGLLESRNVKTVSLSLESTSQDSQRSLKKPLPYSDQAEPERKQAVPLRTESIDSAGDKADRKSTDLDVSAHNALVDSIPDEDSEEAALDQLVDDFDALDL